MRKEKAKSLIRRYRPPSRCVLRYSTDPAGHYRHPDDFQNPSPADQVGPTRPFQGGIGRLAGEDIQCFAGFMRNFRLDQMPENREIRVEIRRTEGKSL